MSDGNDTSRRKLILSGGAAGILGFSGGLVSVTRDRSIDHDRRAIVEGSDVDLAVEWAAWYNDERLVNRSEPDGGEDSLPGLELTNVLPGDSGKIHAELTIGDDSTDVEAAKLEMRLRAPPDSFAENGRTESERAAGDATPERGELQEAVDVRTWYDTGVGDVDVLGGCNASHDMTEDVIAEGTLAEVSRPDEIGEWTTLDANPDRPGGDCLHRDGKLCIGLQWTLAGQGIDANLLQTDAVAFVVEFRAEPCG